MRISDWSSTCALPILSHRYTREDYRDPASQIGLAAQDTQSDTQRTLLSIGRRFELVQDTLTAERTAYSADDKISEVPTRAAKRYAISNGIAAQIGDTRRYNASLIAGWSRDQADGAHDDRWQFEPAIGASQRFDSCLAAVNLGHRQRLPTFFEGSLAASYGSFGTYGAKAVVNAPLTADVALRIAGQYSHSDGYARNIRTGEKLQGGERYSGRAQLQGEFGRLTALLSADHSRDDFSRDARYLLPPPVPVPAGLEAL